MPTTKNKTNAKPNRKVGAPKGNRNAIGNSGRPSGYKGEEHCRIVREMAKLGARDEDMARALGIALSTFHLWRTNFIEFSEAIRMEKEAVDAAVERSLIRTLSATASTMRRSSKRA
jgi:uncharacterized protein YjcR